MRIHSLKFSYSQFNQHINSLIHNYIFMHTFIHILEQNLYQIYNLIQSIYSLIHKNSQLNAIHFTIIQKFKEVKLELYNHHPLQYDIANHNCHHRNHPSF